MQVDSADFETIATPLPTDWVMRVVIRGSGLVFGATPMLARVGSQAVQGLMPTLAEGVVLGFLTAVPDDGDELRIGYANGEDLASTGVTYSAPDA
ncbi:hypothetical protein GA0070609_2912 [Micromonospora echinaurantiaca]|uniref:Uncharacterized protein n=1 Tax=Micromonospora echinaurantiaca TaxID=47857 RepID=A0A1C5I723_9ACTN|nr:hypothetical protein [Micromonospora echinaurantiaca]SCG54222.1 hypothetical protein GA0070609_2912 [Micromonospora echinaurantiaca]